MESPEPDCFYPLADLPQRPSIVGHAIDTGWWELDQIFKFYPGQFTVITGIASHGKSTFVLNLLQSLARRHGIGSFLYVPENESHLCEKISKLWQGNSFEDFAARQCIVLSSTPENPTTPAKDIYWVLDQAWRAIGKHKIELVVVDPWNELERVKPKDQSMPDYITECLMAIKQFCRATNAIFIMVAHPTKDVREASGALRTPTLADIEGSMAWYNKCDNGLIVVREKDCVTKVISAKVREIGAGRRGACLFTVDSETGLFTPQKGAVDESGLDFGTGKDRGNYRGNRKDKGRPEGDWSRFDGID